MIRSVIFWAHLASGLAAGLVVLVMSATGVLLTYERQIVALADRGRLSDEAPNASPRPLEELIAAAEATEPSFIATSISVPRASSEPVSVRAGRASARYVERHSAQVLGEGASGVRAFFREVEAWHRWLGLDGERRAEGRMITGAANFVFLCLIVTGAYLWLPRAWRWAAFKARLFFNPKATAGKARDFNWHHVLGIWSAIPLAVIVASGVVFSYPWANDLVYKSFGETPPARGPGAGAGSSRPLGAARAAASMTDAREADSARPLALDDLLARASAAVDDWRTITIDLGGRDGAGAIAFDVDRGNGGQPQRRSRLILDAYTGAVVAEEPFSSQSPGRRARTMLRFLHTGEALGLAGQTIAGLVTAASLVMLWTGWALAYRRLVRPLLERARASERRRRYAPR